MYPRILNIPRRENFFLFGARGTGKSSFLKEYFKDELFVCPEAYIDLLQSAQEREFLKNPDLLEKRVRAIVGKTSIVIVDEVQKVPKLLDLVHRMIEDSHLNIQFALTGSSARKLKAGGANMLAGRAFLREIFPLAHIELGADFDLNRCLNFGLLPKIWNGLSDSDAKEFLESYAQTYVKEEILVEQVLRKIEPFQSFLEIAGNQNGQLLNYSSIARDAGVDGKTVKSFYSILEDTLLGFHLSSFQSSIRKRLRQADKFYFFDGGIARSLAGHLHISVTEGTSYYGTQFEAFVINEIYKLNKYHRSGWKLAYFQTEAGLEIDLVLHAPQKKTKFIAIKSTESIRDDHLHSLLLLEKEMPDAEFYCLSRDPFAKVFGRVKAFPWKQGLVELGLA